MCAGAHWHVRSSDGVVVVGSRATCPTTQERTLARTGYIIAGSPVAIGSDTDPMVMVSRASAMLGIHRPSRRPVTMASPIHTARYLSRVDIRAGFPIAGAGVVLLAVMRPVWWRG